MQKKFGIAVVAALNEVSTIALPRPGVRKSSRRPLISRLRMPVAA